jgi:hypothetical protein
MRAPLCLVAVCFSLGCAATPVPVLPATPLLPEDPASPAPELSMSWKTVQTACDAETRRLVDARRASQSNKRTVEAVLAGAAGAMALGSAVHAALADDGPNAFVIVPLAGGSAAAAAPLTVMLLDADRDDATEERLARIEDQRDRVRDAHDAWLGTARESGRRATRKEQVDGGGGGQGRGENRGPRAAFEATDKALAAAAARLAEAETAVRALPSEKDKKPEPARADALARLEAAKRELEAATNASNQARSEVRDAREDRAERMAEKTARADDASLAAAHALDAELARLAAICRGP